MDKNEGVALYKQAWKLAAEGRYIEALPLLDTLLRVYPNESQLLYAKAMCLAKLGRFEESLALCEKLERDHNHARAAALKAQLTATAVPRPAPVAATPSRRRVSPMLAVVAMGAAVLLAGAAFMLLRGETTQAPGSDPVARAVASAQTDAFPSPAPSPSPSPVAPAVPPAETGVSSLEQADVHAGLNDAAGSAMQGSPGPETTLSNADVEALLKKGGNSWSSTPTLGNAAPGDVFWIWPAEDRLLTRAGTDSYIRLKCHWRLRPGKSIPSSGDIYCVAVMSGSGRIDITFETVDPDHTDGVLEISFNASQYSGEGIVPFFLAVNLAEYNSPASNVLLLPIKFSQ